jgi:hypothetical protein
MMARPDVLNRLKELGWDGPTSYTLPYLNEMISSLEGGMSVDELKASRKKTSSPEVKGNGNGRAPKGEWVAATPPTDAEGFTAPDLGAETEFEGTRWRVVALTDPEGVLQYEKFMPTVKQPKEKVEKGEWVSCERPVNVPDDVQPNVEFSIDGVKYRYQLGITQDEIWLKWQPKVKKVAKGPLKGQVSDWDPREMLRVFENEDMRVRTGGRDWTMIDSDFLAEQLAGAQERGEAAVLIDVDGSPESCDVPWLEALIAVKRRLALREETNGDEAVPAGGS